MSKVKLIDSAEFAANIKDGKEHALVDFYADWCGPCKVIAPLVEKLSEEYSDRMKFYKLDVDKSGEIAQEFSVRGIPTLIIFGGGELKDTLVGAVDEDKLTKFIEKNL